MSRIRILLLLSNPGVGGTETFCADLASLLQQNGSDSLIANLRPNPELQQRCQRLGVPYTQLEDTQAISRSKTALRLLHELRNRDIVYTFGLRVTLQTRLLTPILGQAVLVHGLRGEDTWRRTRHVLIDRITDPLVHCFIANSEHLALLRQTREGTSQDKIKVIPNGIDVSRFSPTAEAWPTRESLGLTPDAHYVCTVANFRPPKGHRFYLAAIRRALELGIPPGVKFLWIGGGDQHELYRRTIASSRLRDRIEVRAPVHDVRPFLFHSDAFVLPSQEEGQPRALLEAMAMGLPPLVTAVGGVPEVVSDRVDGLIVPYGDVEQFARALQVLISQWPKSASAATVRQKIVNSFNRERMVTQHFEIFDELLCRHVR